MNSYSYLAYEKAAREQKMRSEISQAKKEANFYIENVEKGNLIAAVEKRKKKKRKLDDSQAELNEVFDQFIDLLIDLLIYLFIA